MNRRDFFSWTMLNLFFSGNSHLYAKKKPEFVYKIGSAITSGNSNYFCIFNCLGYELIKIKLPFRAHDSLYISDLQKFVVISRRPGSEFIVFDLKDKTKTKLIKAPKARHFYGHGVYSRTSNLLFLTENHHYYSDDRSGSIGIYDPFRDFRRVGEFQTYGIGPHEIKIAKNGKLIIANGGILTHPDFPRVKLNLSDINSNLSIISQSNGKLQKQFKLRKEYKDFSIRHFDTKESEILAGCQTYNRSKNKTLSTVFKCNLEKLTFFKIPNNYQKFDNYVGSIKVLSNKNLVYASFPRSGYVLAWNINTHKLTSSHRKFDVCGLAQVPRNELMLASSGKGAIQNLSGYQKNLFIKEKYQFDNHLLTFI